MLHPDTVRATSIILSVFTLFFGSCKKPQQPKVKDEERTLAFLSNPTEDEFHASGSVNRLSESQSDFLKKSADSLVNWYPWGDEAFERARLENRPVFISIGYSSCHWCYTMEKESFRDPEIAALINRHFVPIKVDRFEHPAVDALFLSYLSATTGRAGWPMNIWVTADRIPFSGGSYFPPEAGNGLPQFSQVLDHIVTQWGKFPEYVKKQSNVDFEKFENGISSLKIDSETRLAPSIFSAGYESIASLYEPLNGGFMSQPKFPQPGVLKFLMRLYSDYPENSYKSKQIRKMVGHTLRNIANGGIRDQLSGGFFRYSIDGYWTVPQFEMILVEEAQLISSYLEFYQISHDPFFLEIAEEAIASVESTFSAPEGGYYASTASNSPLKPGGEELLEGAYFTWTFDEIKDLLTKDEWEMIRRHYEISPNGNTPIVAGISDDLKRRNVLHVAESIEEIASATGKNEGKVTALILSAKEKLLEARSLRLKPHLDKSLVSGWNAEMVSTLIQAYKVTGKQTYRDRATKAMKFLRETLIADAKVLHIARGSSALDMEGTCSDYALVITALLDMQSIDSADFLTEAIALQNTAINHLYDPVNHGFFDNIKGAAGENLPRIKLFLDADGGSPNGLMLSNLVKFDDLLGEKMFDDKIEKSFLLFAPEIRRSPISHAGALLSLHEYLTPSRQAIVVGDASTVETQQILSAIHSRHMPSTLVMVLDEDAPPKFISDSNSYLKNMKSQGGIPTLFLCKENQCDSPSNELEQIKQQLDSL